MIVPKEGYLLATRIQAETTTQSGIKQTSKQASADRPEVAEIVKSGSEAYKKGQWVIYVPFAAHDVTHKDKEYLFISEDDVLGIIE